MVIYDLCIIGAGMYGSAAARYASANAALNVILIGPDEPEEKEFSSREIFGSHYDEGRIAMVMDGNKCNQHLAKETIQRFRELEKLSGIEFYKPVGFLVIVKRNSECMEDISRDAAIGNIPILYINSNSAMKNRLESDEAAMFEDFGAGYISPRKLIQAQQKVAKMQGCTILNDIVEEVTDQENDENRRFHKILTAKKEIVRSKRVIICAGAFTNFKKLVPTNETMEPEMSVDKETAVLMQISDNEAERLQTMPPLSWFISKSIKEDMLGVYILPPIMYPDGNYYLKIGHIHMPSGSLRTLQAVKEWYLGSGDKEMVKDLPNWIPKLIPGIEILSTKAVTCVSCSNSTDLPYIERVSPTITLAVVGNAKGAKLSDEIGRLASKLAAYAEWDSPLPQTAFNVIWRERNIHSEL